MGVLAFRAELLTAFMAGDVLDFRYVLGGYRRDAVSRASRL